MIEETGDSIVGVGPKTLLAFFSNSGKVRRAALLPVNSCSTLFLNLSKVFRDPSKAACSLASCFFFCSQHFSFNQASSFANSAFLPPLPSIPCSC